ncbi:MAG: ATP-binding protein [Acidobacteria bacterium]|nr:ATP-binding protein [Acidobacteriota bacterium]
MLKISNKLSLPLDAVTQVFAFLGRRSSGKTYGASKLAELMLEAKAQIVALDVVGVWYGLRLAKDGRSPGFPIPVFGGLHGDVPIDSHTGALVADLVVDREYSAVIDISQMIASEQTRFAYEFITRLFERKKARPSAIHLFLEECQEVAPQNPQKDETKKLHAFERLIKLGRNFGIGASLISQRPQEVNKKVLNQAECLFAFQMTGPQERKAIEGWIADKGVNEDIFNLLPGLEIGTPRAWSPQWLKFSETIRIAEKKTYDASSTPVVGAKPVEVKELSPVDIAQINEAMQAVVEKQKADDPKALRQKIVQLEREVTQLRAHQCPEAGNQTAISEEAERRLVYLIGEFKQEAERLLEGVQRKTEELGHQVVEARSCVFTNSALLWDEVAKFVNTTVQNQPAHPIERSHKTFNRGVEKPKPIAQPKSADGISRPQQAILDALAWFEAVGIDSPSRSNVAAIAGVSPRSSGYRANVSTLSGMELVYYPQADCLGLTEKGRATANQANAPAGLAELHQAWMNSRALSQPQKLLLQILLQIYPRSISREDLAAKAGVSSLSSGFRANVSTLSGLQLVVYPASNMVQANGYLLFPTGLR